MAATTIEKILQVVDTRDVEEIGDRWVPIAGSGDARPCDRCGRLHEVHALVLLSDGTHATVGTGCAAKEDAETAKRFRSADRAAKKIRVLQASIVAEEARLARWAAAKEQAAAMALPPIQEETIEGKVSQEEIPVLRMDDRTVWVHLTGDTPERREDLARDWRRARALQIAALRVPPQAWVLSGLQDDLRKTEARLAALLGDA